VKLGFQLASRFLHGLYGFTVQARHCLEQLGVGSESLYLGTLGDERIRGE
jgi:hypothetical protein